MSITLAPAVATGGDGGYRDLVTNHNYADRSFDGTAMTVGEMAIHLIEKAVNDLRTMEAWKDKTEDEIVKAELISRFMHNLGNAPQIGVQIPVHGPAMSLRTEHFGAYSMNGMFWLSGFRRGVFKSKEEMGCGEATLDQLHRRVREELERASGGTEPSMPSYDLLDMRSGPARKPHGWYGVTINDPDGDTFDMSEIIWPHANESAIEIAVGKIMLTASCLYVHTEKFKRQLNDERAQVSAVLGKIPLNSIRIKDFQAGYGAPPLDSRAVTYTIEYMAKDEFLRPHCVRHDISIIQGGGTDPYEVLRKTIAAQKRRHSRSAMSVSKPAVLLSMHKGDLDILAEHFDQRREYNSPEHSYRLRDGEIDLEAALDSEGRVRYEEGVLRVREHDVPETVIQSIKGRMIREIVDHPVLEGCRIKRAKHLKDHLAIYLDVPFISQKEFEQMRRKEKDQHDDPDMA